MIDWPKTLIDDVGRRRAILFLGAGVSRNSVGADNRTRPPLWDEFLRICIAEYRGQKKYVRGLVSRGDYLTAAEMLKHSLAEKWLEVITRAFVEPRFKAAPIHEAIFKLDVRICVTQNIDKIYDTFAQTESHNTIAVKRHFDDDVANAIRGDSRCILKAHGTIDQPTKMVFTRSEYARARTENAAFYSILDALMLTHTFVFIGSGTSDPDVQLLLERLAQVHSQARPHFMVASKGALSAEHAASIKRTMNLRVLEYPASKTHHHLTAAIQDLVEHVDLKRKELAGSRDW